jgi:hypothetical protein
MLCGGTSAAGMAAARQATGPAEPRAPAHCARTSKLKISVRTLRMWDNDAPPA